MARKDSVSARVESVPLDFFILRLQHGTNIMAGVQVLVRRFGLKSFLDSFRVYYVIAALPLCAAVCVTQLRKVAQSRERASR